MPRCKKDYKNLNIKLDRRISEQFEIYCDKMGQTKTTALERILQKFLEELSEKDTKNKEKE